MEAMGESSLQNCFYDKILGNVVESLPFVHKKRNTCKARNYVGVQSLPCEQKI